MTTKKSFIDNLDLSNARIDNRWTVDKLARAGYAFSGERPCNNCRESVAFYKKRGATDRERDQWLVLVPETLEPHHC